MFAHLPSRCLQRFIAALLLGAVLWSASVAVAAMTMGCCTEQQACCTVDTTLSCTSCVSCLNTPSAQAAPAAPGQTSVTITYPPLAVCQRSADIWRPPKALPASTLV